MRCFVTFEGDGRSLKLSPDNEDALVNAYGANNDVLDCKTVEGKRVMAWHESWEPKSSNGTPGKRYKVLIEPIVDGPPTAERIALDRIRSAAANDIDDDSIDGSLSPLARAAKVF